MWGYVMSSLRTLARFLFLGDRLLASIFLLLTLIYFSETFSLERTLASDVVGPASFPRLLAALGAALAVAYLIQRWRQREDIDSRSEGGNILDAVVELSPVIVLVGYVIILEPLGFVPATFLYFSTTMVLLGEGWLKSVMYAVIIATLIFTLFYYGLQAPIPTGELLPLDPLLSLMEDFIENL